MAARKKKAAKKVAKKPRRRRKPAEPAEPAPPSSPGATLPGLEDKVGRSYIDVQLDALKPEGVEAPAPEGVEALGFKNTDQLALAIKALFASAGGAGAQKELTVESLWTLSDTEAGIYATGVEISMRRYGTDWTEKYAPYVLLVAAGRIAFNIYMTWRLRKAEAVASEPTEEPAP